MKLSLIIFALVEAAKNGRGGKHGRVDISDNERFNWKIPKCIQNKDAYCTSETVLSDDQGSIVFNETNYRNLEVSLHRSTISM